MRKIEKNYKMSLLTISFSLFANSAMAQTCGIAPSCESMGYTQTADNCATTIDILRCPLDLSKMFCISEHSGDPCEIGYILNSDKTCSKFYQSEKIPIGIVFDKEQRLAVALGDAPGSMELAPNWKESDKVSGMSDCSVYDENMPKMLTCNPNGKENTSKLIAKYGDSIGYAVGYCANYVTLGTNKGDWYLPSFAEIAKMYGAMGKINETAELIKVGRFQLEYDYIHDEVTGGSTAIYHRPYHHSSMRIFEYINDWHSSYCRSSYCFVRPIIAF